MQTFRSASTPCAPSTACGWLPERRGRIELGKHGELRPGLALGQVVNLSKNGFSYSFVLGEVAYAVGRLLVSGRASTMPYSISTPDIENVARVNDPSPSQHHTCRISELQFGVGVRL